MAEEKDAFGRDAQHPYAIPLKGWWQVAQRVVTEVQRDNISIVSAGCAYYALFAIFPILTALVSLYGLLTDAATVEQQLGFLQDVLPHQAYGMLIEQTRRLVESPYSSLRWSLLLSLGLALWSTMMSTQALFAAMNIAYEQPETRPFIRFYLGVILFAVLGSVAAATVMSVIVYLPLVFNIFGPLPYFDLLLRVVRWPFLAAMLMLGLTVLYRYAPCRAPARWRWVSVGALVATVSWLIVSALFSAYVDHIANYDRTYGSLGAVIVLLVWLYLTFYVILLGAEINAELELQTELDTTAGVPKPIGQRGAFVADHIAGGPGGERRPLSPVAHDPAMAKRHFGAKFKPRKQHARLAGVAAVIGSAAYFFGRWRR